MHKLLMFGLVVLLAGFAPAPQAATQKTGTPTGESKSASSARKGAIAPRPYLGAIVVDAATGKVLFEDNADSRGQPASMLKLMDLLIILEKIEEHQLAFQDLVPVSAAAARTGGSRVFQRLIIKTA